MPALPCHVFFAMVALTLLSTGTWGAEPEQWMAGVAKVSITPTEPVWMAGYAARSGPSDGVLCDLHARGLVLADARSNRLVVVTLDLIEIPQSLRDRITAMAAKSHGLDPTELLVNVSHTHGGPMVSSKTIADWGIDPVWGRRAEAYVEFLVERINAVIAVALANQAPVTLGHSAARCDVAMNRRLPTPEGVRLAPNPDGEVDHDVPVLRIMSAEGKLLAVVFGYACHNTALGPSRMLNGDYAGFALEKLEADHPEAVALFLMGCGGDQDPSPRRNDDDAVANGKALAAAVERGLAEAPVWLAPRLAVSLEVCPLPFAELPPRAELESRADSPNGFVARHARFVLESWPHPGDQPPDYPLPVQVVAFGDTLTLVALGGEPMVAYSIRLKEELAQDGRQVWVAGYSNLVHAYVPTRRVLAEGGYEGTEAVIYQSLPGPFRDDIEERIVGSVLHQAESLRGGDAAP
ncbi:MAG: hypothetical protein DWH79_11870 [Planctomycetota bacterium]|nr:MAG: hypothetical protein DWH79_11870 [Planctomycetota bacterium]